QAAGVIHTDFEKKFIKADCVTYEDFISAGGWHGAKEQGKVRQEGREYVMQGGDVVEFKIGA
ncbi:MAG: GTP-dependent nucleic acid-binding protein EngD, partial [uncultured bacterium]